MSGINPITRSAAWVRASALRAKARELPRPADAPQAHAAGVPVDRILLIGSGVAVGWGAPSWDEALAGQLARAVSARTGRGVDVDVIADPDMSVHNATRYLDGVKLWRYAAVVVALGFNESMDLMFPQVWAGQLEALLGRLRADAPVETALLVLGSPPTESLPHLSERFSAAVDAHIERLDAAADEVAPHFVPLRADGWADDIADRLVPLLREGDPRGYDSEADRQRAVDALPSTDWNSTDDIRSVLHLARDLFGTEVALFTLIDRDTMRRAAYLGSDDEAVLRISSFCSVTIQQRGALVVGDATKDPRFARSPLVTDDPNLRFYAGFPVTAPDGEPVGALCVYDTAPRDPAVVDEATLRRLALLIQAEVHRVASSGSARP